MRAAITLTSAVLMWALGCSAAQALTGRISQAHPQDPASVTSGVISLPFGQTISFSLGSQPTILRLAVPAGLTPTKLSARLVSTIPAQTIVSARPTESSFARPVITTAKVNEGRTPFYMPMAGASVIDGFVEVSFKAVEQKNEGFCGTEVMGSITVQNIVLETQGKPTIPTSGLDFLNASVETVHVVIPNNPSDNSMAAGLNAVAVVSHVLPKSARVILLTKQSESKLSHMDSVRSRRIEIVPTGESVTTSISLDSNRIPMLTIAGPDDALLGEVTTLGRRLNTLVEGKLIAPSSSAASSANMLTQSLNNFGAEENLALTGFGTSTRSFSIPQASFGGPIERATIHLSGTHTSIPAYLGASMNVFWNDYLISSKTLTSTSVNEMETIDVPATRMRGTNDLKLSFTAIPRETKCSGPVGLLPVGFYVDTAATTIVGVRGESLNSGFPRFPQVLANALPVAFGTGLTSDTSTTSAGDLVSSLQKVNPALLSVSVVQPDTFIDSCMTGLFIGATAQDATRLESPVRLSDFSSVKGTELADGVGSAEAVGILEGFARSSCNVLMLGSWGTGFESQQQLLAAHLAEYPATAQYGWSELYGSVLVDLPGIAKPIQLTTQEILPQEEVKKEFNSYALWFLLGLGVVIVLGLAGAWRRSIRTKKIRTYIDAEMATQESADIQDQDTSEES
ncbi:MAG: cellulose biosynthesis cyclic di-GMP-binding regulatory protein BcsB [Candidatus Nanopelagicales bacterium]|nr:cellulose biosynthesis cyclic di-GMP-binding regulatory protein BcsB [Candidatus Nanopelagicales bacterium]